MEREKRGGLAEDTNQKQLISPRDCLQGPALPTIAFLQVHLVAGRKEAPCSPWGGRATEGWEMRLGAEREAERQAEGGRESEGGGKKESANPNVDL